MKSTKKCTAVLLILALALSTGACSGGSIGSQTDAGNAERAESYREEVAEYGEKLLARADFYDYCAAEDEKSGAEEDGRITSSYAQYMTGLVSVGKYRTGDGKGAMETAFLLNRNSFPENNAVVTLAMSVIERGDAVFASELLSECKAQMDKVDFDKEQDVQNLQTMISILEDFCA